MTVTVTYDEALVDEIAARFDLREPNKRALRDIVKAIDEADGEFREMIADLATGVGKTFLMSSLIEYLAQQGIRHVLVVTPGSTIQRKTLENFDAASAKYISGADIAPFVITPDNFQLGSVATALHDPNRLKVFVFNVQQLIKPKDVESAEGTKGTAGIQQARRVRRTDETIGGSLYVYMENTDDLFVIADEHHIYHEKAKAFSAAIRDLHPLALIGLTATPDTNDYGKIVSQYTLGEAIADGFVKTPVIVYRKDGIKDDRTQLRDACQLLRHKEESYAKYRAAVPDSPKVRPVLFVVCKSIADATEVGEILSEPEYIGDPAAVLEVTSQSSDEALEALASVEKTDSPIMAIVSVNMLGIGWDVKNIAVITALRRLASQTLTEQILGRGLRLPFGERTGVPDVDQVDLVAHDSYHKLLEQKDVLRQRIQLPSNAIEVDENGAATTTTVTPGGETAPVGHETVLEGLDEAIPEDSAGPALVFTETEERLAIPEPKTEGRVAGSPQITFPLRLPKPVALPFTLSDITSEDAEKAGARFAEEVPT
jgi:type III restriction enzyme